MVKIHFEIMSKYEQKGEPVSVAVLFPKGKADYGDLPLFTVQRGEETYPVQYKVTVDWEDGSIKWLLVNFLVDLPANHAVDYWLSREEGGSQPLTPVVFKEDGHVVIDTGGIKAILSSVGADHIFSTIETGGYLYNERTVMGPYMTDRTDRQYMTRIGDDGWEILEDGPVRAVLCTEDKHYDELGESWFDYKLFVYAYRNKDWLEFDYQFINCEEDREHKEYYDLELSAEAVGFKYSRDYAYEDVKEIEVRIDLGCGGG